MALDLLGVHAGLVRHWYAQHLICKPMAAEDSFLFLFGALYSSIDQLALLELLLHGSQ